MSVTFELVDRVTFIKEAVRGRRTLHLGCANSPYTRESIARNMLLHPDLESLASEIYGFDLDQAGLDMLSAQGSTNLYRADLERLAEVPLDTVFDVIVAGEMIEHLSNPGLFLDGIKRFMGPGTDLVITTINAYSAMRFAMYGLRGRGGENEPVHPDHVAYYSYRTLKLVVERNGLELRRFCFYDVGPEHRPNLHWFYKLINDVSVKLSPQLCDGVVAVCGLPGGGKE
jgi:SAM-dependent methyltransferase